MRFFAALAACLGTGVVFGAQPASVPDLLQSIDSLASQESPLFAVDTRLRAAEALKLLYPELRHQMIESAWSTFRGIDAEAAEGIAGRMFEAYYGYDPQQSRSVLERKVKGPEETARLSRANALRDQLQSGSPDPAAAGLEMKSACVDVSAPELARSCLEIYTEVAARLYRAKAAPPGDPSLRARFEVARLIEAADVASDFAAQDLFGHTLSLDAQRGKVVVLAFWASWCRPCHAEMPILEKLSQNKQVTIFGINQELIDIATRFFVDDNGYTFPSLIDVQGRISRQYGVSAIPVTIIINREGRLVQRINGFQQGGETELEAAVEKALAR
jgi:thiol-disulfide isomerase/thioredoxin